MKKLFAIIMSVLMIACFMPSMAFADPPAGSETSAVTAKWEDIVASQPETGYVVNDEAKTVTISSAEGLVWFAKQANGTADIEGSTANDFAGYTISLTNDINLSGNDWTPIADFEGTFDGQNHTISGLKISTLGKGTSGGKEQSATGLIAWLNNGAEVKDLKIDGANIDLNEVSGTQNYIGVLAGNASNATITNVAVTNASIQTDAEYVGGLLGSSIATIGGCMVSNSEIIGKEEVGGLVGYQWIRGFDKCKSLDNEVTATASRAGGIAGKLAAQTGNVNNEVASVKVTNSTVSGGSVTAPDCVGGITAQFFGDVSYYSITGNTVEGLALNAGTIGNEDIVQMSALATIRSKYSNETFLNALKTNISDNNLQAIITDWKRVTAITGEKDNKTVSIEDVADLIVYERCVAQIGDEKYATLNDAIEAAQDGDTVNIIADCTIEPVEIGPSEEEESWTEGITIEGNDHTVTGWDTTTRDNDDYALAIDVYSKVTFNKIKFTSFGCGDNSTTIDAAIINGCSGCDITITNCSFENFNRQAIMFAPGSGGKMTVEDSDFDCTLPTNINKTNSIQKAFVIEPGTAGSEVTIKGCTITYAESTAEDWTAGGIEIFSGTVTIEGSTLTNCDEGVLVSREYFNVMNEWSDYDVSSDVALINNTISAKNSAVYINCYKDGETEANVKIESGNHEGVVGIAACKKNEESEPASEEDLERCKLTITGGTFTADPSAYVKDNETNYIVKRSGEAESYTYTVLKKANLTSGVYLTDPSGALASRYYVSSTADNVWTVSYAGSGSSSSATTTDNVVNNTEEKTTDSSDTTGATTVATTTATVKAETKTTAEGAKTVAATVDTATADKIVEKAISNTSKEVVVNAATAKAVTETAAGTTTEIALPELTVQALSEKTEASVTIKSDAAEVTLDKAAVDGLAAQAGDDGYVRLVVETVKQEPKLMQVDLKLVTSKGTVSDFQGGNVSVTVKLNDTLATKEVTCVYINNGGIYHKVNGTKNTGGTYTFITGHFSSYAIMALDEAEEVIAEQTAKVKELASKIQLKARSVKTAKGNIKVRLKITKGADSFKALEDMGYTLKYQFYRSTEMRKNYKYKFETLGAPYTNTDAKKGTRYYYKARIVVYDEEGKLVTKTDLKRCWYATRIR